MHRFKNPTGLPLCQVILIGALALVFGGGCASEKNIKAGAGWAEKFYNQPNNTEIFHVEGTNVVWNISGATKIVVSTPVPMKSVIPRDPTWTESMFDAIKTVAPYAFLGWAVHEGAFGGTGDTTTSTVNNYSGTTATQ